MLKDAFFLAALALAVVSGQAVAEPAATVKSTASLASGSQPPGRGEQVPPSAAPSCKACAIRARPASETSS